MAKYRLIGVIVGLIVFLAGIAMYLSAAGSHEVGNGVMIFGGVIIFLSLFGEKLGWFD